MNNIVILGSLNMDLVIDIEHLPKIGETICGQSISYFLGGKGANQGVCASRVIDGVSLIGCVGNDFFGTVLLKQLKKERLDISGVNIMEGISTGVASIFKTRYDNAIVTVAGANSYCDVQKIKEQTNLIRDSKVLLLQLEIPIDTVVYAIKEAKSSNTKVILNPAPYRNLPNELIDSVDYITPNETEFEYMYGSEFNDDKSLEKAMVCWQMSHPNTRLIVTRGRIGASYVKEEIVATSESLKVNVNDTTGAGDTFNGLFACCIASQKELDYAVKFATTGASLSVQYIGAQTGMPTLNEINKYMVQNG